MIYRLFKPVLKIALWVFFKKMVVTGKENIPTKGPLLIVGNHPNTLMDPLIVASITRQQVAFLGNAGIFVNKLVNKVFAYFHVIPIYRKKDIKPGEKPDNSASFAACHRYLQNGGTIVLFPEGSSYYELKLRQIKTGTARIALSFEKANDYKGKLLICPVSLDYSDSLQFRSMLGVHVGEPIVVSQFKDAYENDEFEGVTQLTEEIRKALAARIPNTVDKNQETFLINVHRFYTTYCEPSADLYKNPRRSLELRSQLAKIMRHLHKHHDSLYGRVNDKLNTFYRMLDEDRITSGFFTEQFQSRRLFWVYMAYFIFFLSFFPIYVFGLVINYLPYILPGWIFKQMNIDIEYKTSVGLVAGLILFPLFYGLEWWAFRTYVSQDVLWNGLFLLALPISGYVSMYFWINLKRFIRLIRFQCSVKKIRKEELTELKNSIKADIDEATQLLAHFNESSSSTA